MNAAQRMRYLLVALVLALGAGAVACATAPAPPPSPAPTAPAAPARAEPTAPTAPAASTAPAPLSPPVQVKVGSSGTVAERGLFIALEKGYFGEEGLEVELVPSRSTTDQIPALITGDLQIANGGAEPSVFNAVQRGLGIKIVNYNIIVGPGDRSSGFVVRKDLVESGQYREPKDFQGRSIALPTAPLAAVYVERLLAPSGLTLADVQIVNLPFPDMVSALGNRAVDAAMLAEPFITVVEAQGSAQEMVPMGDVYPGVAANVMTMSPLFGDQQPGAARRFITAHLRGLRDYYRAAQRNEGGRDEIVQILVKHTPMKNPNQYGRLLTSPVDPNLELSPRSLEEIQDYFVRTGLLTQSVDVRQVLDRSYADYALQRLGRMP